MSTAHSALPHWNIDQTGHTVAVVGAGGIGLETARLCAEAGAQLEMIDVREVAPELRHTLAGSHLHRWHTADLTDSTDFTRVSDICGQCDALVITSAYFPDESQLHPSTDEWLVQFEKVFALNVAATMRLSQLTAETMLERGRGRIVIVGSVAGRMGGLLSGRCDQYADDLRPCPSRHLADTSTKSRPTR